MRNMDQLSLNPDWPRSPLSPHLKTGKNGEDAARRFLSRKGMSILGMNVRVGLRDEIDIIAFDPADQVIVFAEVKTRTKNDADYRPEMNMTPHKRNVLTRAARAWISETGWKGGYRMDLLCVTGKSAVTHFREIPWGETS
jgi:putative endonuclease